MAKRRMYARGRPQSRQRLCCCTGNFGGRCALAIIDFFATVFSLFLSRYAARWKGMPMSSSSRRAS